MARRKTQKKPQAVHSDTGTPQRRQHSPVTIDRVSGEGGVLYRDVAKAEPTDDPIHRYRKQRTITPLQRDAAMAYRALDDKAIKRPSLIGGYGERITGGNAEMFVIESERHYERLKAAEAAMGMYCSTVKSAVIFEKDLLRGQIPWLRNGLDNLIRHFGM